MAHYLAGTAVGPGAATDFFNQLLTHIQANGWTVLWSTASTAMAKGTPLDAVAGNAPYCYINVVNTTTIQFTGYSDVDTTTHVGIQGGSAQSLSVQDASFSFWIRANPVACAFAVKAGTAYNKAYFGYPRRGLAPVDAGLTKTTAAVAVGTTLLPVASDMTGKLRVGVGVMLMNYAHNNASPNKANAEIVTVTGVAAGSIAVSAVTKAYDAGALIGIAPNFSGAAIYNGSSGTMGSLYCGYDALGGSGGYGYSIYGEELSNVAYVNPTNDTKLFGSGVFAVNSTTAGKHASIGSLYHLIFFQADGSIQAEDPLDDGASTYLTIGTYVADAAALGPREN